MRVNIELSDQDASALQAKAAAEGLSLEEWIRRLAETSTAPRRHIADVIRDNMGDVPQEIMASMPEDGAAQHDHYIYGRPKKKA